MSEGILGLVPELKRLEASIMADEAAHPIANRVDLRAHWAHSIGILINRIDGPRYEKLVLAIGIPESAILAASEAGGDDVGPRFSYEEAARTAHKHGLPLEFPVAAPVVAEGGVKQEAFACVAAEAFDDGQIVIATLPNNALAIYSSRADAERSLGGDEGFIRERVVPITLLAALSAKEEEK